MKNEKGFTLVELVMSIVIIGVLAVVALPRFLNFSSESRASALEGIKGSVITALTLTHSVAQIENQLGENGAIDVDGESHALRYGYLVAGEIPEFLSFDELQINPSIPVLTGGYSYFAMLGKADAIGVIINYDGINPNMCYVKYSPASETSEPVVEIETSGC